MKLKQLKPLQHFLKRNLKRSKKSSRTLIILLYLFISNIPTWAITSQVQIKSTPTITITHNLINADTSRILEAINSGYTSLIVLQVRIYKKRDFPYSILGDEVIEELEIVKEAKADIFSESYIVECDQKISYYTEKRELIDRFLTMELEIPHINIIPGELKSHYVKMKATIINKDYISPFNIFYLINFKNKITTGWIDYPLQQDNK